MKNSSFKIGQLVTICFGDSELVLSFDGKEYRQEYLNKIPGVIADILDKDTIAVEFEIDGQECHLIEDVKYFKPFVQKVEIDKGYENLFV